jgi:hypothetical protein
VNGNQIRDNIIKATGYDYPHLPGLGNNDEKLGNKIGTYKNK